MSTDEISKNTEDVSKAKLNDARNRRVRKKARDASRRDPKTEPTERTMFTDRMKREGRLGELNDGIRTRMNEKGEPWHTAWLNVAESMGYEPVKEVRIHREHKENLHIDCAEMALAREAAEERTATATAIMVDEFEKALSTLPSNATKQREIEWIEAHPAMMRKARTTNVETLLITADDILRAPHGVCPSRSAAGMLQHWVNNVSEFYKQIMSEAKKKSAEGGAGGSEETAKDEEDVKEIENMLAGIRGAKARS